MSSNITKLSITGLNGNTNVSVQIKKNKLVLVGRNGLGKSTFINVLYFLLSKQWNKLLEIEFTSLKLETSEGTIGIKKSDVQEEIRWREEGLGKFPSRYVRFLNDLRSDDQLDRFFETTDEAELRRFASKLAIPSSSLRRFRDDARQAHVSAVTSRAIPAAVKFMDNLLGNRQILFLPTYRRIEKDLRIVIPELDEYIRRYNESPARTKSSLREGNAYLELVEFGMEDVEKKFSQTLDSLKDNARQVFNSLAGSYLRDVIRGHGQKYDRDEILSLDEKDVKDILNRVEENTLSDPDKLLLQQSISRLSTENQLDRDDAYVAHIFSKLISTSKTLQEREKPITGFVKACNKYLDDKKIVYNEIRYEINVKDSRDRNIDLQFLSSGEKQIISLFSHLYLSGDKKYIIIIDEPELSLSMPWQYTFLPDIVSSGHCDFIAAVTHSPFISDNELDDFTVDMKECVRYS